MGVARPTASPLFGRDRERAAIRDILADAKARRSRVLVIRGEAGIGKSSMLADAESQASEMQVLRATGLQTESELPFAALFQLLRPALALLDRIPGPQRAALRQAFGIEFGPTVDRFLVSVATLSLLAELAEQRPVLCLIDDAQWLDDASTAALTFVARRLGAEAIGMILAVRDDGSVSFDAHGLPELVLTGLEVDAAESLLSHLARASVSRDVRDRLMQSSAGNSLALVELASLLTRRQLSGHDPLPVPLPVTRGIERAFLSRVRRLPDDSQTLLLLAATDTSGQLGTILRAAHSQGVNLQALHPAEATGLVVVHSNQVSFRHPLIRSAIYDGATFSARQRAHLALAGVLTDPADIYARTWHHAAAAVEPDDEVATQLEQIAERSRKQNALAAAAAALERSAELTRSPEIRARRLAAAARGYWMDGQVERVGPLVERARPLTADVFVLTDLDQLQGSIEMESGVSQPAFDTFVRAAATIAPLDPRRSLELLVLAAEAASLSGDRGAGIRLGQIATCVSPQHDTGSQLLRTFHIGMAAHLAKDYARSVPMLQETIRLAAASAGDGSNVLGSAGRAAIFTGDDDGLFRFHDEALRAARSSGSVNVIPIIASRLAMAEFFRGHWSAAIATADEAVQLARATGQEALLDHPLTRLGLIAAFRGDDESCDSIVAEVADRLGGHQTVLVRDGLRWLTAARYLGAGRSHDAFKELEDIAHPGVWIFAAFDAIEAAARAGLVELAEQWLAEFGAWASQTGAAWALARMAHGRALLASDADAEEWFSQALAHHAQAQRPFEHARTALAYGEFLRRERRRVDARDALRTALRIFEELGASPWEERARAELRASGVSVRKRDDRVVEDLTPQETQVVRYVARGLSTRDVASQLFLSPRTIDFHLRNVFAKLGISSRTELMSLVLSDGIPGLLESNPVVSPARAR